MAKIKSKSGVSNSADPFGEVKVVSFSFSSSSRNDAAFKQFSLLLNPEILQAHLDFYSKIGKIVCVSGLDEKKALSDLVLNPKLRSVEWLSYKDYQKRNVVCSD